MESNLIKIIEKSKAKAKYDPLEYIKEQSKYAEVKK